MKRFFFWNSAPVGFGGILVSALCLTVFCGCALLEPDLPPGKVPESLVNPGNPGEKTSSFDAESAMCGAIARTLIRKGYYSEKQAKMEIPFGADTTDRFETLLTGTGLIVFTASGDADFRLESASSAEAWTLRLKDREGKTVLEKTILPEQPANRRNP